MMNRNDNEFQILPDGDYNFTVTGFERGRHQGSAKLPPCNKAIITLNVADGKGNQGTIKHNLFLHTKTEGMLCAFFTAIGQRKHGEKMRMNWSAVVGATGRCKIGIHEYTSTKTGEVLKSNKIKKILMSRQEHKPNQRNHLRRHLLREVFKAV